MRLKALSERTTPHTIDVLYGFLFLKCVNVRKCLQRIDLLISHRTTEHIKGIILIVFGFHKILALFKIRPDVSDVFCVGFIFHVDLGNSV